MNEAELLFTDILGCDRLRLYLNRNLRLNKVKAAFVSSVLKRRIKFEPIDYILGKTQFMGLEFKVTSDIFIPRPETEILVETALKYTSCLARMAYRILDLGTGSGCIAVSSAKFLPTARIEATDISQAALNIAKINAKLNNVDNKINFIHGDLFKTYNLQPMTYDLIISNPPYIATSEIDNLQPEISYEPRIALDGGKDGLDFYRRIIKEAGHYLRKNGFLIMEMGFNQCSAVKEITADSGNFSILEVVCDYNGIERIIVARYG